MEPEKAKTPEEENFNTVGCGVATLLGGVGILAIAWASYAPGYRPIGTGASIIFGAILALVGIYRITMGIAAKWRQKR